MLSLNPLKLEETSETYSNRSRQTKHSNYLFNCHWIKGPSIYYMWWGVIQTHSEFLKGRGVNSEFLKMRHSNYHFCRLHIKYIKRKGNWKGAQKFSNILKRKLPFVNLRTTGLIYINLPIDQKQLSQSTSLFDLEHRMAIIQM